MPASRIGHLPSNTEGNTAMAHKQKALQRSAHRTRPALESPKRAEPEPRSRCIPAGTQHVELKARSFEEIGTHLQRSSKRVELNTDEPDVD